MFEHMDNCALFSNFGSVLLRRFTTLLSEKQRLSSRCYMRLE